MSSSIHSHCSQDEIQLSSDSWIIDINNPPNFQQPGGRLPKIQTVPINLRTNNANEKLFKPSCFSMGPIHHKNVECQKMKDFKLKMVQLFCVENQITGEMMNAKVLDILNEAKDFYDDATIAGISDREFSKMMVYDGGSALQFIIMESKKESISNNYKNKLMCRDLLLFENQIPMIVLEALLSLTSKKGYLEYMVTKLLDIEPCPKITKDCLPVKPIHLLDLARSLFIGGSKETKDNEKESPNPESSCNLSAEDLWENGIDFRSSKTRLFSDVHFENNLFSGTLFLPQLEIDEFTKSRLLNMAVFEACFDGHSGFEVASYLYLMNGIIRKPKDVMRLRKDGIINGLGSDQTATKFFKEIGSDLVLNPNGYALLRKNIERHYKNKPKIWIAQCWRIHFKTPWTILHVIAASAIVILGLTQTAFTGLDLHN